MKLGYVMAPGATDLLLAEAARLLMQRGLRLCGTVQVNTERAGSHRCDMDLLVLPGGSARRISQDRGPGARGCRLDAGALESAVAEVAAALDRHADLLIVNKFGRHEAEGRGFRAVIAQALERGVPVLVGLAPLNREAFDRFAAGLAVEVGAGLPAILAWADPGGLGAGQTVPAGRRNSHSAAPPITR